MFNNPFKKKICTCGKLYEANLSNCPHCHDINEEAIIARKYPNCFFDTSIRQLVAFGIGWIGLQAISLILSFIALFVLEIRNNGDLELTAEQLQSPGILMLLNCICYGLIFVAFIIFFWSKFKELLKTFTKFKSYLYGLIGGCLLVGASMVYSVIIQMIAPDITSNNNQVAVEEMMHLFPISSVIFLVIIGPICEELTYRIGLFSFLKKINRPLAYIGASLIFGLIHFDFTSITNGGFLIELANLPSYIISGAILCFIYEYKGFASSATAHIFNNLLSFIILMFASGSAS